MAELDHIRFTGIEQACAIGYESIVGDIAGWGSIHGKGGGQSVASCQECADLCDYEGTCGSYECSTTMLRCNLNVARQPTQEPHQDYIFCSKAD